MLLAEADIMLVAEPLAPGQVVSDRYEVLERLGKGGMGVVFAAHDARLGRKVALKFVRLERADDKAYSKRLEREARVAGGLVHENIAQVLDYGTDRRRPYVVIEFIDGETLDDVLDEEGPLSIEHATDLVTQVCRGLLAAHEAGVIHRDIKTSNLMVTTRADGAELVKILDFGIARFEGLADCPDGTTTGGPAGTPHYMAPEVARGENKGDILTDIYSVGVVLFELLAGRKPHDGSSHNAVLYNVTTRRPPPIRKFAPHLPESLVRIVNEAMDPEPENRTPSVAALLEQLTQFTISDQCASDVDAKVPVDRDVPRGSRRWRLLASGAAALSVTSAYCVGRMHAIEAAPPSVAVASPSTAGSECGGAERLVEPHGSVAITTATLIGPRANSGLVELKPEIVSPVPPPRQGDSAAIPAVPVPLGRPRHEPATPNAFNSRLDEATGFDAENPYE